jgi:DNA repair protein SbcD/Mre11
VRILHTSDWHVGKRLGRHDRMDEHRAALAEVERLADEREADLVLISGDLFDRPMPPVEALGAVMGSLLRLGAERPVVAVAGNHDSPELLEALAPLLRPGNVHVVGHIRRPEDGGVIGPDELGAPAAVACFPFLREGRVVDFMEESGSWYGSYAERVASLSRALGSAAERAAGRDAVPLLVAHFMVSGVKLGRDGPRGERSLHIGDAYAATEQALGAGPQYVAMGHIHAPQKVPGAAVPARYAGSLLPLDFGEAGEDKGVVIVDAVPGRLATTEFVPIDAGIPLIRAHGTWEELSARDDLRDAYLDLTVRTAGPQPGLAETAREAFPRLVNVRTDYERMAASEHLAAGARDWAEAYADYVRAADGVEPPAELLAAFREVFDEVLHAPD